MEPSLFSLFVIVFASGLGLGFIIGKSYRKHTEKQERRLVRVGRSNVSGRGVFAINNIAQGDIIERCPVLELDEDDVGGELMNYVFYGDDESTRLVAMGNGMLFNHSSFPNVGYYLDETPLGAELVIYALRNIRKDEELFYNYGDAWWTSRNMMDTN